VLSDDVADLAIGLVIAVARRVVVADRFVRSGAWARARMAPNRRLAGRRLGILGFGRIGRAVAVRAEACGMVVSYGGPRRRPESRHDWHPTALALAQASDVLVVATPGGDGTRGLVDAGVIEALGPEGILVNIARGSVVDEAALVAALVSGRLGGAGLDVFADEPRVPEALLGLDTVVFSPHVGANTVETLAAMGTLVVDNVVAWFEGRPLLTPVPRPL
jgi:lactate dehydrogenase-like 2-hydroxyacid dehydrogenase